MKKRLAVPPVGVGRIRKVGEWARANANVKTNVKANANVKTNVNVKTLKTPITVREALLDRFSLA
ncbi:hypothetical protein WME90_32150 [Sorangium sp. So ce375]|uniref:hypothetical protein n=1 Tax=Sorangium sp. So ce375 TaxID=3133306 RepID=UPI003F5BD16B